jgi:hypothetical protein
LAPSAFHGCIFFADLIFGRASEFDGGVGCLLLLQQQQQQETESPSGVYGSCEELDKLGFSAFALHFALLGHGPLA